MYPSNSLSQEPGYSTDEEVVLEAQLSSNWVFPGTLRLTNRRLIWASKGGKHPEAYNRSNIEVLECSKRPRSTAGWGMLSLGVLMTVVSVAMLLYLNAEYPAHPSWPHPTLILGLACLNLIMGGVIVMGLILLFLTLRPHLSVVTKKGKSYDFYVNKPAEWVRQWSEVLEIAENQQSLVENRRDE